MFYALTYLLTCFLGSRNTGSSFVRDSYARVCIDLYSAREHTNRLSKFRTTKHFELILFDGAACVWRLTPLLWDEVEAVNCSSQVPMTAAGSPLCCFPGNCGSVWRMRRITSTNASRIPRLAGLFGTRWKNRPAWPPVFFQRPVLGIVINHM